MGKEFPAVQETQETWVQLFDQDDPWRKKWQPTPVFLPEKFYGQRSLVGYSLWSHKELDMTEQLSTAEHCLRVTSVLLGYFPGLHCAPGMH